MGFLRLGGGWFKAYYHHHENGLHCQFIVTVAVAVPLDPLSGWLCGLIDIE
jgi:hypothetical protein